MGLMEAPPVADAVDGESLAERCLSLPGGVFDAQGRVHRLVRVRELTGADEEALFDRTEPSGARRVSAFLARAIDSFEGMSGPIDTGFTEALHLGDRDYLLLRLRQLDLGDSVHQVLRCVGCAAKVDVDLLISELPVRRLAAPLPAFAVSLGGHALQVRLPTGADQHAVESLALANPAAANTRLFARLVQNVDGAGPPSEEAVRAWPVALRSGLSAWLQSQLPGPDLSLDLACPLCHADMSCTFDLHSFFLPSA
jgi:hypothetical protein